MGYVPCTGECPHGSLWHHGGNPIHNERKKGGTLVPNRQESRRCKSAQAAEIDLQRIAFFGSFLESWAAPVAIGSTLKVKADVATENR